MQKPLSKVNKTVVNIKNGSTSANKAAQNAKTQNAKRKKHNPKNALIRTQSAQRCNFG